MKPFVNPVEMKIPVAKESNPLFFHRPEIDSSAFIAENLVTLSEKEYILDFLRQTAWQPVSITGMQGNYEPGDPIGSWRASSFQEEYASVLFERILKFIPEVKKCNDSTNTDWDGTEKWIPVGVNPLLRFIKYTDGGYLVPHYDAPYVASDEERTLASVVIYLDNDETMNGGAVQFLNDPQAGIPVHLRDLSDLTDEAKEEDIRISLHPKPGSALVFDHRILHESQKIHGPGQKTIIRTDIMYRRG
jgi:hypothetical protein